MARNTVHGENSGIQVGAVHGGITMRRNGKVVITGTTGDDDSNVVNEVHGDFDGVQVGTVHGGITFG